MKWLTELKRRRQERKERREKEEYEAERAKAEQLYDTIQRARMRGGKVDIDFGTILYLEEYGFKF